MTFRVSSEKTFQNEDWGLYSAESMRKRRIFAYVNRRLRKGENKYSYSNENIELFQIEP